MLDPGDGGVRCFCGNQAYWLIMLVVGDLRCCLGGGHWSGRSPGMLDCGDGGVR